MSNRNAAQALAKKQQLDAIASKAKSCNRRISSLQRRIPEMKAREAAIPQLEQLVSSLHNKAQLSIRIFVTIDGRDVTLYKAG
jgi:prefoldin subunit 5